MIKDSLKKHFKSFGQNPQRTSAAPSDSSGSADSGNSVFYPSGWSYWETYPWIHNNGTWYYMKPFGGDNYLYNYTTREWKVMSE